MCLLLLCQVPDENPDLHLRIVTDHKSAARVITGALLLPYISVFVGRLCFGYFNMHRIDRSVCGWIVYSTVREFLGAAYTRQSKLSRETASIANYDGQ